MQQLEPSAGKGVGKLIRVFMESFGNFVVGRISRSAISAVVNIVGTRIDASSTSVNRLWIDRMPDMRASRAFGQLFIAKQQIKITIIPFDWIGSPCTLNTASNGIAASTRSISAFPAKAHFFNRRRFWFGSTAPRHPHHAPYQSVATGHQRNGFVVHCHTPKVSRTSLALASGSGLPSGLQD